MANHVSNVLSITSEVPEAIEAFYDVFTKITSLEEQGLQYSHFLPQWGGEWPNRDYMEEVIGANWATFESIDDDNINITSAWSSISSYIKNLGHYLYEIDPNVIITCKYIDELYNFAGVVLFHDHGIDWREESGNWFIEEKNLEGSIDDEWGVLPSDPDDAELFLTTAIDNFLERWEKQLIKISRNDT
tara:strand:+ start:955 stop:1518 length:564 start_codon:yes stop_codon:yes gene_type:complete